MAWVQDQFTWGRLDLGSDPGTNKFRCRTKMFGVDLRYVQDILTWGRIKLGPSSSGVDLAYIQD